MKNITKSVRGYLSRKYRVVAAVAVVAIVSAQNSFAAAAADVQVVEAADSLGLTFDAIFLVMVAIALSMVGIRFVRRIK